MKKIFVLAMLAVTSMVSAAEINVVEADLPPLNTFRSMVDSRFYVDKATGEGFVKVDVSEERYIYHGPSYPRGPYPGPWYPAPVPTPTYVSVYRDTVKVPGLVLVGDKVMYHSNEAAVDCGTLGVSRIFKKPTIYLSGNCTLTDRVISTSRGAKVIVNLKIK